MTQPTEEFIADLRQALTEDPSAPCIGVGIVGMTDTIGIDGEINLRFLAKWLEASGYRKMYLSRVKLGVNSWVRGAGDDQA